LPQLRGGDAAGAGGRSPNRARGRRPAPAAARSGPARTAGAGGAAVGQSDSLTVRRLTVRRSVCPTTMRQAGFEPTTFGSGGRRSIQLSYWRDVMCLEDTRRPPRTAAVEVAA